MLRLSLLFKYNLFLTSLIFISFLTFNDNYSLTSFILSFFGSISTAATLCLIIYIASFIFILFGKFGLFLTSFIFTLTNIILLVDFFIYRIYNFHINAMVINILTSPKAYSSIDLGLNAICIAFGVIAILITLQILFIRNINSLQIEILKLKNRHLNRILILPLFLIILSEKMFYGFASLYNKSEFISPFKAIPLYQPLTFEEVAVKYFDVKITQKPLSNFMTKGVLNYPKNTLFCHENAPRPHIFVIASDSVNYRFITPELAPNITAFKNDCLNFNNHYSGGNSTRFGIFSLFYGLNSTYWFSFLNENRSTIFFDFLQDRNYDINIVQSANASWPEFRKTAYANVKNIFDDFEGEPWQKDEKSSTKFLSIIDKMDISKPQFAFLFLDAPHGYSFSPEFNKHKPSDGFNYMSLKKDNDDFINAINRYKNSILFNDALFGKIIEKLKQKGLYENSIIIYTSDHGQEFFEHGFFGHNSSFSATQAKVPFIMKTPENKHKMIDKLTSHLDFVPTILSFLGVKNDPKDYSNGFNMLDSYERKSVFCANWNNNAIITPTHTFVFSNLPNKIFSNEARKSDTYELKDAVIDNALLMQIMEENSRFFK